MLVLEWDGVGGGWCVCIVTVCVANDSENQSDLFFQTLKLY